MSIRKESILKVAIAILMITALALCALMPKNSAEAYAKAEDDDPLNFDLSAFKREWTDEDRVLNTEIFQFRYDENGKEVWDNDKLRTEATNFSTALAFPFTDKEEEQLENYKTQLESTIMHSPGFAYAWAQALYEIILDPKTGSTIGDLDKTGVWLNEFITDFEREQADIEAGLLDKNTYYAMNSNNMIVLSDKFLDYAWGITQILDVCTIKGVESWETNISWANNHAANRILRRGVRVDEEKDPLGSLILEYRQKDGTIVFHIGANLTDKRPELFVTKRGGYKTNIGGPDSNPPRELKKDGWKYIPHSDEGSGPADDPGPGPFTRNVDGKSEADGRVIVYPENKAPSDVVPANATVDDNSDQIKPAQVHPDSHDTPEHNAGTSETNTGIPNMPD